MMRLKISDFLEKYKEAAFIIGYIVIEVSN